MPYHGMSSTPLVFRIVLPLVLAMLMAIGILLLVAAPWPFKIVGAAFVLGTGWGVVAIWRDMNAWDTQAKRSRDQWKRINATTDPAEQLKLLRELD